MLAQGLLKLAQACPVLAPEVLRAQALPTVCVASPSYEGYIMGQLETSLKVPLRRFPSPLFSFSFYPVTGDQKVAGYYVQSGLYQQPHSDRKSVV